jgi:hypothetical protein
VQKIGQNFILKRETMNPMVVGGHIRTNDDFAVVESENIRRCRVTRKTKM